MTSFDSSSIIKQTVLYVKSELEGAEGGHDWFHVERVYKTALHIARHEQPIDELVTVLGALLHDIADYKFTGGNESIGPEKARVFLNHQNLQQDRIEAVIKIIENVSFKGGNFKAKYDSKELRVVQDADRLDAMGAIGIARAFNYGGYKNRKIFDPAVLPNLNMSEKEYKKSAGPTLNHFYEKLLLLKDRMHTPTGRKMAIQRHDFMEGYLQQFYAEWSPGEEVDFFRAARQVE